MLATARSAIPPSAYVVLLGAVAWALLGALLTVRVDRKDAAHYYETYDWAERADGLFVASLVGVLLASVGGLVVLTHRPTGPATGTVDLVVVAAVAATISAAAAGILCSGHRIVVPGSLAGGGGGTCLLAMLGLAGIGNHNLIRTAALGWVIGVGAAFVIMIVAVVATVATDPMP